MVANPSSPTSFPARGAQVTVSTEEIRVTRSPLASSLHPNVARPADELIGWYKQAPEGCSPGYIQLLFDAERPRVNFSPSQAEEFAALDLQLTNLQAGYPLEVGAGSAGAGAENAAGSASTAGTEFTEVSAAEWVSSAESASGGDEGASQKKQQKRSPAPWAKVATPDEVPETNEEADIDGPIYGQTVCVTGDVEPYGKGEVWDMIASRGGVVAKNVTKKTTMLIVGDWHSMTSKEKRARELQDKGQELQIIRFQEFLQLIK
ncbi:BRCT domain-containing protein [Corynebacterium jeikeium]|uniref:BRCT domain-containing protein n=1 Tax=Corynebacterium jeikeium TaxID=38289 RepID=UPI00088B6F17|nr:BRCT domain-containing protein [Corynebacterium jeikeium]SCX10541.1 DNA polymerase III subunit epsilon [Corynebacterium jeikeium]